MKFLGPVNLNLSIDYILVWFQVLFEDVQKLFFLTWSRLYCEIFRPYRLSRIDYVAYCLFWLAFSCIRNIQRDSLCDNNFQTFVKQLDWFWRMKPISFSIILYNNFYFIINSFSKYATGQWNDWNESKQSITVIEKKTINLCMCKTMGR